MQIQQMQQLSREQTLPASAKLEASDDTMDGDVGVGVGVLVKEENTTADKKEKKEEEDEEDEEEEQGEEAMEQDGKQFNPLYHSAPSAFMQVPTPSPLPTSSLPITSTTTHVNPASSTTPNPLLFSHPLTSRPSSAQDPLYRSPMQPHHVQPWMQSSDPTQWQQVCFSVIFSPFSPQDIFT
jgi:hypothetical protein